MDINNSIVFFDGECNLCNSAVDFIIKYDKAKYFKYCWLQNDYAKKKLEPEKINMDTIILYDNHKVYKKSDAVFHIVKHLTYPYKMLYAFSFLPNFIKDFFYDQMAKYRYNIFGKKSSCKIPNEKKRELFIL